MSLTSGGGPLNPNRSGRFNRPVPDDLVYVEPYPRRVRAVRGGATVLDTEAAVMIHRPGHAPAWAFPPEMVGGLPHEPSADAPGMVTVPWDAVDHWFEETDEVFWHPRNPYHRVDCMPTDRRLRVSAGGVVLVDTTDTVLVQETSLAPRLYVAKAHVRMDLLTTTDTVTYCNYKGKTTYWSVTVDGVTFPDAAWSYEAVRDESTKIAGHLSFDDHVVTVHAQLPPRT